MRSTREPVGLPAVDAPPGHWEPQLPRGTWGRFRVVPTTGDPCYPRARRCICVA